VRITEETRQKLEVIERARQQEGRLTVRRIYYILLSRGFYDLTKSRNAKYAWHVYQNLSNRLVDWREAGLLKPEVIIDRKSELLKRPAYESFDECFDEALRDYTTDSMLKQKRAIEVWLEKDTMRNIFEEECWFNDVPLIISKGWTSWTFKEEAAKRFKQYGKPVTVLYFGDFDFEGEHIPRVLEDFIRKKSPSVDFKFNKVLLKYADYESLQDYAIKFEAKEKHLEHVYVKEFIDQYGPVKLEVEALAFNVTKERFQAALFKEIDTRVVDAEGRRREKELKVWRERHYR
jgi:hypothetical protein